MKRTQANKPLLTSSASIGCSFQDIRRGTGLDSSVVNSSLWQMNKDGR